MSRVNKTTGFAVDSNVIDRYLSALGSSLQNKTKWLRHKLLFPFLATLPSSVAYRLANLIGKRDAKNDVSRQPLIDGMTQLFPEQAQKTAWLETQICRHFQMMARDMLDCFRMPKFTREKNSEELRVNNVEKLIEARDSGRGVIMIISHFSRFFMLGPGLKFSGVQFGMLTTMVDDSHPYYDAVDRWYISTKLHNTQMFSRGSWITTADDPRKIFRALKSGEIILIALDGNETSSPKRLSFPFCGGELSLPEGIVRIAEKTGARLIYAGTSDRGRGVDITLHSLPDNPHEALRTAVGILEQELQKNPWQWWLWPGLKPLWLPGTNKTDGVG